jgi:hypothetical protein
MQWTKDVIAALNCPFRVVDIEKSAASWRVLQERRWAKQHGMIRIEDIGGYLDKAPDSVLKEIIAQNTKIYDEIIEVCCKSKPSTMRRLQKIRDAEK